MENDYLKINKKLWNYRVQSHYESDFYDVETFLKTRNSLNAIELQLLGQLSGKTVLHLQCHFGQDTLSLANLGAIATGVDFSDKAIAKARHLSKITQIDAHFIESDIYNLPNVLDQKFDLVFSSYGTIGWLPDMHKWAKVVSHFLKPGGRLLLVEFHPFVWMFDARFEEIQYAYFNREVIIEEKTESYASNAQESGNYELGWNHNLAEVFQALLSEGLKITDFQEYDYSPYNIFPQMTENEVGQFRIKKFDDRIPLIYSLLCQK